MEAEFGDLFFALVNAARLYGIDPEAALERTNLKFISRFNYLESQTIKKGMDLKRMSLDEMDQYWDEAKQMEKETGDGKPEMGDQRTEDGEKMNLQLKKRP
jgi:XTP/dITP diphosphohydrolase